MEQPSNLLACPFCGKSVIAGEVHQGIGERYRQWCDHCGAFGPNDETPEDAHKAWNRRAGAGRASQDNGGKQLCSSAWLDVLCEELRGQIAFCDNGANKNPIPAHKAEWRATKAALNFVLGAVERTKERTSGSAAATAEVVSWAQCVLTALNVGDVQSGSKPSKTPRCDDCL